MKNFEFISKAKYFVLGSVIVLLIGVVMMFVNGGLKMGLDFTGGSLMTIQMGEKYDEADIKQAFNDQGIDEIQITTSNEDDGVAIVRMKTIEDGAEETQVRLDVMDSIIENYPKAEMISVERVGGIASGEMIQSAIWASLIACVLMLVYITIRFELLSGIAAVIALFHDMFIMIAFMAIFNLTINSSFVAAILTIFGYSINDTIVMFDRIRENRKRLSRKEYSFEEVVNKSIRDTMARSINTSFTTLVAIATLYIFGVDSIKEFSLPIIVGLISGTYSSIFIASPIWNKFNNAPIFNKKAKYNGKKGLKTRKV